MSNTLTISILDMLDAQRSFITKIEELSEEEINWSPLPDKNSIGNLLDHLIGSERFHVHEKIFGIEINRIREKEFEKKSRSKKSLLASYQEMATKTRELLKTKLEDERFLEPSLGDDKTKTVFWRLTHVIEHNYYHIGQINLLIGLRKSNNSK